MGAEVQLRETIEADLQTLFEHQADPEASAMAAFPSRDLAAFLEHQAKIQADASVINRTIVAGGVIVGSIGSWQAGRARDIGYWIGREHWGNGFATAALRAFLEIETHRPLHAHVRRSQRGIEARPREVRLRTRALAAGGRRPRARVGAPRLTTAQPLRRVGRYPVHA
jgi:Acetyltransferase (GNAT) domain